MHLIFIYSLKFFGHARTFLGHSRTIISLSRTTQGHPSNFLEEGFSIIQTLELVQISQSGHVITLEKTESCDCDQVRMWGTG